MKKTFLLFFLSLAMISNAQDNNTQALFYNIGLGAVTGSVTLRSLLAFNIT